MVLPVVLIFSIVFSAHRVSTSADAGLLAYTWCWRERLISADPPADVLLIGSSRSGLGIDPSLVEAELEDGATFERVTFGGNNELEKNLGLRTYLENRGVPETLVLELGLNQENTALPSNPSARAPLMVTKQTPQEFAAGTYSSLLGDLSADGVIGLDDQYVRSRVVSPVRFWFETLQAGFDTALRHPSSVIHRATRECVPRTLVFGRRWVDGNSRQYKERRASLPNASDLEAMELASASAMPVDFTSSTTRQELALTRDMIREARSAGVDHVILMYLPSFGVAADKIDIDEVALQLPATDVFDARTVLFDESRPLLRMQYADITHLNVFGAHEVSMELADVLDEVRSG